MKIENVMIAGRGDIRLKIAWQTLLWVLRW
jgi:hypothetical protein